MTSTVRESEAYGVLRALRQIIRRISEHSKALYRDVGLTVPQLLCLRAIGDLDAEDVEVTVAAVSRQVQLSSATVSRILDRLERSGLVHRERRSTDRRRVCLALTAAGTERFQSLPTPLQEEFVARFLALGKDERQRLQAALDKVSEMMEAQDIEAAPLLTPSLDEPREPDS